MIYDNKPKTLLLFLLFVSMFWVWGLLQTRKAGNLEVGNEQVEARIIPEIPNPLVDFRFIDQPKDNPCPKGWRSIQIFDHTGVYDCCTVYGKSTDQTVCDTTPIKERL